MARQRAQTITTTSDWMDLDERSNSEVSLEGSQSPTISSFTGIAVTQQPLSPNSCGLSTILNAWAVMLSIPINPDFERLQGRSNKDYLVNGLDMVNMALSGHMDSWAIQACIERLWVFAASRPKRRKGRRPFSCPGSRYELSPLTRDLILSGSCGFAVGVLWVCA